VPVLVWRTCACVDFDRLVRCDPQAPAHLRIGRIAERRAKPAIRKLSLSAEFRILQSRFLIL
ncbi:MAG TPA: hypothetical protein VN541_04405, partial [Tepidisphaeraceae bacterium]|nr:hypothetical protein [Tepidisphaeraceae bacterium]